MGKKQDDFSFAILRELEGMGRIEMKEICEKSGYFIKENPQTNLFCYCHESVTIEVWEGRKGVVEHQGGSYTLLER